MVVQKLVSLMQLCFFGLGGGALRKEPVDSFKKAWVAYVNGDLFYTLGSNKKGHLAANPSDPETHKLPRCIMRCFLVANKIFSVFMDVDTPDCFPKIKEREYHMGNAAGEAFHLGGCIDGRVLRQFFCSITNILWPNDNLMLEAVAQDDVAKISHHTSQTAALNYGTLRASRRGEIYLTTHQFLGDCTSTVDHATVDSTPVSDACMLRALRLLLGDPDAMWRDEYQKEAAELFCNAHQHHQFYSLRCGWGKSFLSMLPLVSQWLRGIGLSTYILVVPYVNLLSHLREEMTACLKRVDAGAFRVESFTASDIGDNGALPASMTYMDSPPHMILLTIDAFGKVVQHHLPLLQRWRRQRILSRLIIDEVQSVCCLLYTSPSPRD